MTQVLKDTELADRWGVSKGTLSNWRAQGRGPKFMKIGKRILYALDEIERFEKEQTRNSTVDPGGANTEGEDK